jgi:hypothetical protein
MIDPLAGQAIYPEIENDLAAGDLGPRCGLYQVDPASRDAVCRLRPSLFLDGHHIRLCVSDPLFVQPSRAPFPFLAPPAILLSPLS